MRAVRGTADLNKTFSYWFAQKKRHSFYKSNIQEIKKLGGQIVSISRQHTGHTFECGKLKAKLTLSDSWPFAL